ncbi:MAG: hypothetical protein GEU82_10835 [Luteitalea sp.]|nr:hypothetical protein [Luteitalea sp.]
MRRVPVWMVRLGSFFGKTQRDRALDDELLSHLHLHIEENIRAGMTPGKARRDAFIALGGLDATREHYRSRRGLPWLEELFQDLRYATRVLGRAPVFTLTAVVSLMLGIGANTLIFSIVNALVFRPLPAAQPEELVFLQRVGGGGFPTFSFPVYRDLRAQNATFDDLVGYRMSPMEVETTEGPARTWGYLATGNYFDVLGVRPRLGRFFHEADDRAPRASPFAVLSFDYWNRAFAADPSIVGSTIQPPLRGRGQRPRR